MQAYEANAPYFRLSPSSVFTTAMRLCGALFNPSIIKGEIQTFTQVRD